MGKTNLDRIKAEFPQHEFDYIFNEPDYDDEIIIEIDGRITNIYDSAEDVLSDDPDDYRYLHNQITNYLNIVSQR